MFHHRSTHSFWLGGPGEFHASGRCVRKCTQFHLHKCVHLPLVEMELRAWAPTIHACGAAHTRASLCPLHTQVDFHMHKHPLLTQPSSRWWPRGQGPLFYRMLSFTRTWEILWKAKGKKKGRKGLEQNLSSVARALPFDQEFQDLLF